MYISWSSFMFRFHPIVRNLTHHKHCSLSFMSFCHPVTDIYYLLIFHVYALFTPTSLPLELISFQCHLTILVIKYLVQS